MESLRSDATTVYNENAVSKHPPLAAGSRLFCLGGVYTSHLEDRGRDLWAIPEQWYVPETAVVGPNEPIVLPDRVGEIVKPAIELAVVIGRGGHNINETDALDHVAGFTISNDITARGDWPGPRGYKIMETFNPCGPTVTPSNEIANPLDLEMTIQNGEEIICRGNTRGHRFTISFIISYMSKLIELQPGDVLSTGDPGNVSAHLQPGTDVKLEIESIGELHNRVEHE
jgi:2-keto-4-pentenoate hydratase/2-oxohepta-3-ene-1,7-dioic acid hydratase in catechol pathway